MNAIVAVDGQQVPITLSNQDYEVAATEVQGFRDMTPAKQAEYAALTKAMNGDVDARTQSSPWEMYLDGVLIYANGQPS